MTISCVATGIRLLGCIYLTIDAKLRSLVRHVRIWNNFSIDKVLRLNWLYVFETWCDEKSRPISRMLDRVSIIFSSFVIFFFFFNLNRREFEGKENLWNVVWEKAEEIDWSELKFWESVVTYFFLSASIRGRNASIRAASITRARSVNVRVNISV